MIAAAAQVGRISSLEVMTKIKTNLQRSDVLEATSSMKKSKALTQTINREKKKVLGHGGIIPNTAKDIMDKLPDKFNITSTGKPFIRYMEYADPVKKKLIVDFHLGPGCLDPRPFPRISTAMGLLSPVLTPLPRSISLWVKWARPRR
jgi:hypothetical protein